MEDNEVSVTDRTEENGKMVAEAEPNYRGIKAMPFVLGNETCEKLGAVGSSANLAVYLSTVFHMSTMSANNVINIFNGTSFLGSVVGAFLSDTFFGRYKTLAFASIASFSGMLMLTLTAAISELHPPKCNHSGSRGECKEPTSGQMAFLLTGFGLMAIGASGIRPCNLSFGADQFNPNAESGRRGITSFFNWYYFTYAFAVVVSATIVVYVQSEISWSIGLAIPTSLMLLACALFFAGTWIYVKVLPQGSPMTSFVQVIVVAFKKRRLKLPDQEYSLFNHVPPNSINSELPRSKNFRFLDKAAILSSEDKVNPDGSADNKWNLCSIQQIEEVKCILRLLPVWISGIAAEISAVEQSNYVIFQALQSNRQAYIGGTKFHIPAGTYSMFSMLTLIICLPIYDRIIIPVLSRYTKNENGITLLQRIGFGMVLIIPAMLISGIVESRRRTAALTRPTIGIQEGQGLISSMSAFWYVPQISLMGLGEGFVYIGQIELFYKEFPENMRSIAASVLLCGVAVASYLASFLNEIVRKATTTGRRARTTSRDWLAQDLNSAKLDYFFYLLAALELINLAYFLVCAKWYRYKRTIA